MGIIRSYIYAPIPQVCNNNIIDSWISNSNMDIMENKAKTLSELVKTKTYKDSRYKVVEVDESYALKVKIGDSYISLSDKYFEWSIADHVREYCLGNQDDIIAKFYELEEIREVREHKDRPLKVKEFSNNAREDKDPHIEDYKSKLMEGLV